MYKPPSTDDLRLAAEWLDNNEGDGGESDSCKLVASYLRRIADRRDDDASLREAIRRSGMVPSPIVCARLRKLLKKHK